MRGLVLLLSSAFLISGCMPKMGEDFAIETGSDIRLENSQAEIVLGMLSIFGGTNKKIPLKIGGDLIIINRWHSDLKLISLEYALVDEKGKLASGSAKIDTKTPFVVTSHTQKKLPLLLIKDSVSLNSERIMAIMHSKGKVTLRGEAVVQVRGKELRYPFEKDAKKVYDQLSSKTLALP